MAKDVVCGMYVDESKTSFKTVRRGGTYYFCSKTCLETFLQPEREFRMLKTLTVFSILIGLLVIFLDHMYPIIFGKQEFFGIDVKIVLFTFATLVQFIAGYRFYRGALDAVKARQANMDLLIAGGTSAAWLYSTIVVFKPGFFEQDVLYFMESTLIIGFILLGRTLEQLVKNRLLDVVNAIELGRKTVSKIRQNLFWAFIYNVILIPVAAGILYPRLLNPVIAAAAMAVSSISVTVNSILLGRWRPSLG